MRRNNFFVKAMIVCIMPLALLSCSKDEESGPSVPENGIKGLATVNALSVSVSGSFSGVSKIDLNLGKTGILYCLKSDTVASVFKAWLDGDNKAACYEYTDGKLTSDTYAGTITNLYPDKDYNYCLFSVGRDGKTVKTSDIYTFHTKKLEPEFKNIRTDSIRYTRFVVKGRVLNISTNDASGCNTGLLLAEDENGEVKAGSKTYETKGVKMDMRILVNELESDSAYCCRPFIKYNTHDNQVHYVYGPAVTVRTNNLDDWAVDLNLPSGVRWSQCELGREDFDDIFDLISNEKIVRVRWGSLLENYYSTDYEEYEYLEGDNYINIGNEISGTEYDIAHAKLGGHWRLPKKEDVEELINNCRVTFDELQYDYEITSGTTTYYYRIGLSYATLASTKNDNSIKIMMQNYWTGTLDENESDYPNGYAYSFIISKDINNYIQLNSYSRLNWMLIRPVWDPNFNN